MPMIWRLLRAHFGIDKPDLIGFSYLGKLVVLYATQHPDHVNRIVQLGPVARKSGTKFPAALTAGDDDKVPDPAEVKKLTDLFNNGFAKEHAKEYCEMEWKIEQQRMVGNPANGGRIPSPCEMENEWPIHLFSHFQRLGASAQALDIPKESIAKLSAPVLTIHGRKDRNAPYGGGREWDMLLPNARLITINGAAHMSWVEFPEIVFPGIDVFLNGKWPEQTETVKSLELPPSKAGGERTNDGNPASVPVQNSDPAWSPNGSKIASFSIDPSGVEAFWRVYDVLKNDAEPSVALWDELFSTPGYAALERNEHKRKVLAEAFRLAHKPSNREKIASALARKDFTSIVLPHLFDVVAKRDRLQTYQTKLQDTQWLPRSLGRTQTLVPAGLTQQHAPPPISFVIFAPDGRGYSDIIVVDLLHLMKTFDPEGFFAHELFHYYRRFFE